MVFKLRQILNTHVLSGFEMYTLPKLMSLTRLGNLESNFEIVQKSSDFEISDTICVVGSKPYWHVGEED